MMTREEVIERLCKLKSEVWRKVVPDASEACDCVCHGRYVNQVELNRVYGGSSDEYFRHSDTAILFMENAVREALKKYQPPLVVSDIDEGDA